MTYRITCKDCRADIGADEIDKRGRPVPQVIQELRAKGLLDDHTKRYSKHRVEVMYVLADNEHNGRILGQVPLYSRR